MDNGRLRLRCITLVMLVETWKPFGVTSCDFTMQKKAELGCSRICHAGRLDPFAQGVMLLLTEEDVKSMAAHLTHEKVYTFDLVLGLSTISHDFASSIVSVVDTSHVEVKELQQQILNFVDKYVHQEYPMISSFLVNKKPMWWYSQNNMPLPLASPPSKSVQIYDVKVHRCMSLSWKDFCNMCHERINMVCNPKTKSDLRIRDWVDQYHANVHADVQLTKVHMSLHVSSGFYIRKFCEDFGRYLGIPCIALDITREQIMPTR